MGNEESMVTDNPKNKDWTSEEAFLKSNYLKHYNTIDKNKLTAEMMENVFTKYSKKVCFVDTQ